MKHTANQVDDVAPIRSVVAPDINPIGGGIVDNSQGGESLLVSLYSIHFLRRSGDS